MTQTNADFNYSFQVYQADGKTPFDLTGAVLIMQIKAQPGAAAATFSTTNGYLILDGIPTTGIFYLSVPKAIMQLIECGHYSWDILNLANNAVVLIGAGYWDITPGITNDPTPQLPGTVTGPGLAALVSGNGNLVLVAGPAGTSGFLRVLAADPVPGTVPIPYLIKVAGSWYFRIMAPSGYYWEVALP